MPPGKMATEKLLTSSEALLREYLSKDKQTLTSDLKVLQNLGLIEVEGDLFQPAMSRLSQHFAGCAYRDRFKDGEQIKKDH